MQINLLHFCPKITTKFVEIIKFTNKLALSGNGPVLFIIVYSVNIFYKKMMEERVLTGLLPDNANKFTHWLLSI